MCVVTALFLFAAFCQGVQSEVLLFTTWNGIYSLPSNFDVDTNISKPNFPVHRFDSPEQITFNPATQNVIWNVHDGAIFTWRYGSLVPPSIITKVGYVDQLKMDWIRNVLFVYVYSSGGIISMNLENEDHGRGTVRLHTLVAKGVYVFCLDGFHNIMYWYDNIVHKLKKKHFHGSATDLYINQYKTYTSRFYRIYDLEVDAKNGFMYIVVGRKIISVREDGEVTELYRNTGGTIILTAKDGNLFWRSDNTINRMEITRDVNTTHDITTVTVDDYVIDLCIGYLPEAVEETSDIIKTNETYKKDIQNCLGYNGISKIKLEKEMICNGVSECYDALDEFYCCYNSTNECGIRNIEINCRPPEESNKLAAVLKSSFFNWNNYLFSAIYTDRSIVESHCSLSGMYIDTFNVQRRIDIYDHREIHIFRQIFGPGVFRKVNQTTKLSITGVISELNKNAFQSFQSLIRLRITETTLKYIKAGAFAKLLALQSLELTRNHFLISIHADAFKGLSSLTLLNISSNDLTEPHDGIFKPLESLNEIDLRGNDLRIKSDLFKNNKKLTIIYGDSEIVCCIKPESVTPQNCITPKDAVTGCKDLIENKPLRVFLWIIAALAVFGNLVVIIYHFVGDKASKAETFNIFVVNLSISDTMMGIYMIIIGVHDAMFLGEYVWNEYNWRHNVLCKLTGIMAFISSESSVIFILFITLDRFLAFSDWKITPKRSYVMVLATWAVSIFTAVLPGMLYEGFYSRSGVCIALPLTGGVGGGFYYSVTVFLGFNFVAFCFIAIGQFLIFRVIKLSSARVGRPLSSKEKTMAKILLLIAVTDCLGWIPIGILVTMSIFGLSIPDVMYSWVVVIIMPINSAINPFLYTFVPAILKIRRERSRIARINANEIEMREMR